MILFDVLKEIAPGMGVVTIGESQRIESLDITGTDVTGLPDGYIPAAGSILTGPKREKYIAIAPGHFVPAF